MHTHSSTYCLSLSHLDLELFLRKGFYSNETPLFALSIQVFSYRLDFLRDQLLAFLKRDSCEGESDKNVVKIS